MWNEANWQPSCRFHHDVVKQRLESLFAQGVITAPDLRLNSVKAVELTRDLQSDLHPGGEGPKI